MSIIISFLLFAGIGLILLDVFKIPEKKTLQAVSGLSNQMKIDEDVVNSALGEFAKWLSKGIFLTRYNRARLEADLRSARMDITPEMFVANAIVKAGIVFVAAFPFLFIAPPVFATFTFFTLAVYLKARHSLPEQIRIKRAEIEYELSGFVFTIEKNIRRTRNIIAILDSYAAIAGPELQKELNITISDMRSGNYETALLRLEARIGSPMMSDICRGLISILRGDDTIAYWQSLEIKFSEYQREKIKEKALRIPNRVHRLSLFLLLTFLATWMFVIGYQMFLSFGGLFKEL